MIRKRVYQKKNQLRKKKTSDFEKDVVSKVKKVSHYACSLEECVSCSENQKCISTKSDRKKVTFGAVLTDSPKGQRNKN